MSIVAIVAVVIVGGVILANADNRSDCEILMRFDSFSVDIYINNFENDFIIFIFY